MRNRRESHEPFVGHAAPAWDYPRILPHEMYGPAREALDWNVRWPDRRFEAFPRVRVGADAGGVPVDVEFKARPENGHGPHVLCVGADGRRKTAFLRTVFIGLADRYSPDRLQFAIAAAGEEAFGMHVPHVAAGVTGLAEPSSQPNLFARAVEEEIWRRSRLPEPALAEEPALVLLIDDVDRIIAARPEFSDALDEIGRAGERIGMHLLLSATDPTGLDSLPCLRVSLDDRGGSLGGRPFRPVFYTPDDLGRFASSFMFYHHPVRSLWNPPDGLTVERMRAKDATGGAGVPLGQVASDGSRDTPPLIALPSRLFDTVTVDFARRSHLLITGEPGCGKTTVVQTVLRGLSEGREDHGAVVLEARKIYWVQDRILAELERRAADQDGWRGPSLYLVADLKQPRRAHVDLEPLEALLRLGRKIGLHLIATADTEPTEDWVFQALEDDDVTRIALSGREAHERRWDTVGSRFGQPGQLDLTRTPIGRARLIGDASCEVQIAMDTEATARPPQFRPLEDLFAVENPAWTAPLAAQIGTTPDGEPFHLDVRGHVWCGGAERTALLRKLAFGLAARYSPAELQLVVVEIGADEIGTDALADTAALSHTAHRAAIADPQGMHRLSVLLDEEIRRRLALEQEGRLASAPPLVVLVDRSGDPAAMVPALVATLERIAAVGGRLRVWLVLAEEDRPSAALYDVRRWIFSRVSLSHDTPRDLQWRLRATDVDVMIWADEHEHLRKGANVIRVGHDDDVAVFRRSEVTPEEVLYARSGWPEVPPAPPLGLTQGLFTYDDLLRDAALTKGGIGIPIGAVDTGKPGIDREQPFRLDFEEHRHFVVAGPARSGRSTVLRTVLRGIARRYTPREAAVVLLHDDDIGSVLPEEYVLARAAGFAPAETLVVEVMRSLRRRIEAPGGGGPRLFFVMDDYEQFDTEHFPLLALRDVIPHAEEIGLHLVLSGSREILGRRDVHSLQAPQLVLRGAPLPGSKLGDTPALVDVGHGEILPSRVRLRLPWCGRPSLPDGRTSADGSSAGGPGPAGLVPEVESRPAGPADDSADDSAGLAGLLGFPAEAFRPLLHWREKPEQEYLRAAVGRLPDGKPLTLDLKTAVEGGMGPHGLLIGENRLGKSAVLRTIVGSLIATHAPEELNLLLVDFRRGAAFAGLGDLPHVSAAITDLADEPGQVERLADALEGELARRQAILRAGRFTSRREYEKARRAGQPLDPLPTLLFVAETFTEMVVVMPEFMNLLVQIGRVGRSVGVHMLLAAERLEAGTLRGLDGFLPYRIALRSSSASESRSVIGSDAAYELPREPGHGYLKVGTESPVRFRTVDGEATAGPETGIGEFPR